MTQPNKPDPMAEDGQGDLEDSELHSKSEGFKSLSAVRSIPEYMKAFNYAWDAGYKSGYQRGKYEANKRRGLWKKEKAAQ